LGEKKNAFDVAGISGDSQRMLVAHVSVQHTPRPRRLQVSAVPGLKIVHKILFGYNFRIRIQI
jgi:hypothetical protein